MKLKYDKATDSLYIDLVDRPSTESREVAEGVVVDVDADGRVVGIDFEHASRHLDLSRLEAEMLPVGLLKVG
ncbi:MAG: DUF2283 domain-containing protein [Phycisphaerales bacterium]